MFTEELKSINEAEAKAEQIRRDAKLEAKAIVDNANSEALRIIGDAELAAKERYDSLIMQGTDSAQAKFEKAIHEAEIDASKMADNARKNQPQAINYIKERMNA